MNDMFNKFYEGDVFGAVKDGINGVRQKHTIEYDLVNDDVIPPVMSKNRPGWFVVRQYSKFGNAIDTGLIVNIPYGYELIIRDMSGQESKITSGQKQALKFEYTGASEDNQKVAYIRVCHYPSFEMKQNR